jgi:arylsulfatase A-like enzyme
VADVDVLPTLLAALGLPQAADLPGRIAPFLETTVPPPVASYADLAIERVETRASDVDESILEKLRTLGYVE